MGQKFWQAGSAARQLFYVKMWKKLQIIYNKLPNPQNKVYRKYPPSSDAFWGKISVPRIKSNDQMMKSCCDRENKVWQRNHILAQHWVCGPYPKDPNPLRQQCRPWTRCSWALATEQASSILYVLIPTRHIYDAKGGGPLPFVHIWRIWLRMCCENTCKITVVPDGLPESSLSQLKVILFKQLFGVSSMFYAEKKSCNSGRSNILFVKQHLVLWQCTS